MKKTIIDLFESSVARYGAKTFLLEKRHRKFEPTTYAETREQALEVGAGLASLGIRPGDKVAILSEGCNAWIISELGLFYAGAISVPLSVKLEESNDRLFRLRHAEVKALFVSKYQLPKIRRIRHEIPGVEHIIVFGHLPLEPGETAFGTLKRLGRDYLAEHREEFMAIGQAIRNDDYATITYTSGTTTSPDTIMSTFMRTATGWTRSRPVCPGSLPQTTGTVPTASPATTTWDRCPPGIFSVSWASIRSLRLRASMRWEYRPLRSSEIAVGIQGKPPIGRKIRPLPDLRTVLAGKTGPRQQGKQTPSHIPTIWY